MLLTILTASFLGGILSLLGGVVLLWREAWARKASMVLLSFATGSLLGAALLELLPEAIEGSSYEQGAVMLIVGILFMFIFETIIKNHHHHIHEVHQHKAFASTVLLGDAIHNFIDGVVIAMAFNVGWPVGLATTVAVFFHEIPQEIGDFGVLLHSGYSRAKILWLNILTSFATVAGALLGYLLLPWVSDLVPLFLAFAAGTFLYISVSDLLPEIKERTGWIVVSHVLAILVGIFVIWVVGAYLH